VLNIIACILTAYGGSIIYDRYKEISGNTVLVKKGKGAVRSLFVIVEKVKNISDRLNKDTNISSEALNLLGLLEKDIVLATQEWTDVIPDLADVEIYSKIIREKELERDERERQYKEVSEKLKDAEESLKRKDVEEEAMAKRIDGLISSVEKMKKTLFQTQREIDEFRLKRDIAISRSTSGAHLYGGETGIMSGSFLGRSLDIKNCAGCSNFYTPQAFGDSGFCDSCLNKMEKR
jgi:myosin heavy subunit